MMATHSDMAPAPPAGPPPSGRLVEYEQFIEDQLRKTRSHVRSVDIAGALMTLAAGTLGYFFLAALVDHWIVSGGLGFWGRLVFLAGYLAAALAYLIREVLPLVVRRINPVYAAYTIERSRPSLKNALVNFLLLRANPAGINEVVYQAIEEQAATQLAKVHVDVTVDRTKLIRVGYGLAALLLICALYTILSPKDLLRTVGRVMMPWAEISAPTRTEIVEIEPGDAQAFRGQQVSIQARVRGLAGDGNVTLFYSTADGQVVDRAVEMTLAPEGYKHLAVLPAGDASLQQSLTYRIQAGDAVTKSYQVEVVAAPTIVVRRVEYKYPPYTGLLSQRVEHQGDLKAIEGTEVTLEAVANQDIQSAHVDFDCDQKLELRMAADQQEAKATFRLSLQDDRRTPEHNCYHLIFKNEQGQSNPRPVRHQIEVTRDLPPEIQFVAPKQDELDLPLNGMVDLEIVANDPDFALRRVQLSGSLGPQPLLDTRLLDETRPGQFVKKFLFDPRKLGLKVGDVVEYSALAEDNKDPRPNRTETAKRRIRVVSPSARTRQDQLAQGDPQGDRQQQEGDGKPGGDDEHPRDNDPRPDEKPPTADPKKADPRDAAPPENGEDPASPDSPAATKPDPRTSNEKDEKEKSPDPTAQQSGSRDDKSRQPQDSNPSVPADGSDDGEAIEQILKHRDEQHKTDPPPADARRHEEQNPGDSPPRDDPKGGQDNSGDGQQKPNPSPQRPGQQDPSAERSPEKDGQKPSDAPTPDGDPSEDPKDRPQPPEAPPGEKDSNGQKSADKKGADKSPPQAPSSSKQSPEPPNKSPGQPGKKGSGAGDSGQGDDAKEGQQGQKGQKGQQGKPSTKGQQSPSGNDGESPDDAKSSQPGGKGPGKPTAAPPGDDDGQDEAAPDGKKAPQGPGTPSKKPAGTADPQATDEEGDPQHGTPQAGEKSAGKPNAKPAPSDAKPAGPGENDPNAEEADGEKSDPQPTDDAKSSHGAQAKEDSTREGNPKHPNASHDPMNPDAQGADSENEKGPAGAGQSGKDKPGSPSPQGKNQPREKSQRASPDEKEAKEDNAAQSPSRSDRESNSEGQTDGDQSGGGKKGGGQKANKPGTGGAGQNTAADEGAGRSEEAGQGETSDRAGHDREAGKKTGQSGSKSGKGSESKSSSDQGAKSGPGTNVQPRPGESAERSPNQPGQESGSQASDRPNGGKPGDSRSGQQPWKPTPDAAEEANLEYARKATDLALEHMKDELRKDRPDADLLKQLGWTRTDLENFVKRWELMRKQSQAPGDQRAGGQRELDEALRSLGLRPRGTSLKSHAGRDDSSQGYKESRRSSPPPEYAEQYKEYTQGVSRGGK